MITVNLLKIVCTLLIKISDNRIEYDLYSDFDAEIKEYELLKKVSHQLSLLTIDHTLTCIEIEHYLTLLNLTEAEVMMMTTSDRNELYRQADALRNQCDNSEYASDLVRESLSLTQILDELDESTDILAAKDVERYQSIIAIVRSDI